MSLAVHHEIDSGLRRNPSWRRVGLIVLALSYAVAGALHLSFPQPFIAITPDWVPWPAEVIRLTGLCELAGASGLLIPRTRRLAAIMLALYAVCVFPANIKHAFWMAGPDASPLRWLYHGPRLALQPVIIWWPLWAAGLIDWPRQTVRGGGPDQRRQNL
jgi:uncharacterized membrane protein